MYFQAVINSIDSCHFISIKWYYLNRNKKKISDKCGWDLKEPAVGKKWGETQFHAL